MFSVGSSCCSSSNQDAAISDKMTRRKADRRKGGKKFKGLPLSCQCTFEPLKVENSPSWSINKRHLKVETKNGLASS